MAYVRKTTDEWIIEGNYGYGWDYLCTEDSKRAARDTAREYRENEGIPVRVVKHRVKIAA